MFANVDLSSFDNTRDSDYQIGRSFFVRLLWFLIGLPLLRSSVITSSRFRAMLLRLFGAEIGDGVVIKPGVRVKFPWRLKVGKHCWIGEDCWVDNLATVTLEENVCISQGVYLCTGSHDWSDPAFRLITQPILIQRGAWIAARVSIAPGAVIGQHSVVGFGSSISGVIPANEIHVGNPAKFLRQRVIHAREQRELEITVAASQGEN